MQKKEDSKFHSDCPILSASEDCFEREGFAKNLANLLLQKSDKSIVVGIEAGWGGGKTSCINLIKEKIRKNSRDTVIVDFKPWFSQFNNLETLVKKLLGTMSYEILKPKYEIYGNKILAWLDKKGLNQCVKIIIWARRCCWFRRSLYSAIAQTTKKFLEKYGMEFNISSEAMKSSLQECLAKLDAPIIVIIDDIDRLQPEEVRIMFQVVKSVCDFTGIHYLLAYDRNPIIQALSYHGVYDGDLYLEKIVQVSCALPVISKFHMQRFFEKEIMKLMGYLEISFDSVEDENRLFEDQKTINALSTPRDIYRLLNQLKLILPALNGEVDLVDGIIFQFLRIKMPLVADLVYKFPQYFVFKYELNQAVYGPTDIYNQYEEQIPYVELLKKLDLSSDKHALAVHILEALFKTDGNPQLSISDIEFDSKKLRVNNPDCLQKLLHQGTNAYSVSIDQIKIFLSCSKSRDKIFAEWSDNGILGSVLFQMQFPVDQIVVDDYVQLFLDIEQYAMKQPQDGYVWIDRFTGVINTSLKKPNMEDSFLYLKDFMHQSKYLCFTSEVLLDNLSDAEMYINGFYDPKKYVSKRTKFTKDQLVALVELWLCKARKLLENSDSFFKEKNILNILFTWGHLADTSERFVELRNYLKDALLEPNNLTSFINAWEEERSIDQIEKFIDPEIDELFNMSESEKAKEIYSYLKKGRDSSGTKSAKERT